MHLRYSNEAPKGILVGMGKCPLPLTEQGHETKANFRYRNKGKHLNMARKSQTTYHPMTTKTCTLEPVLSVHSKRRPQIGIQDRLWLNAGQKYCRMPLQGEYSAILSTFI